MHPFYDFMIYMFILLAVFVRDWMDEAKVEKESVIAWIYLQLLINYYFTFEMIILFILDGSYRYTLSRTKVKVEIIVSIINTALLIKYLFFGSIGLEYRLIEIIAVLRILRIFTFLKELRQWKIILRTIDALLNPFYTLLLIQIMIYYSFSVIGDVCFGGTIGRNSEEIFRDLSVANNYVYLNFNDGASSFVTLFMCMLVSSWHVIAELYTTVTGTQLAKFYFIVFYILSVVIIINIIVAFVIDMYSSVEDIVGRRNGKQQKMEESTHGLDADIGEEEYNHEFSDDSNEGESNCLIKFRK